MIDMQEKFSEQLTQFSQYQKDAVAKLQAKSAPGVDTFEKLTRYNLAVMGDVVDFTVAQARLATSTTEPQEYFSRQIDSASAFAKVVEGRTKEYIDLLSSAAETVTEDVQEATREAVVEAVKKSA
jgi:hypothetical protein